MCQEVTVTVDVTLIADHYLLIHVGDTWNLVDIYEWTNDND